MLATSIFFGTILQSTKAVSCRWHDEFDHQDEWKHIATSNKPNLDWSRAGKLGLTLPHVPRDWPYEYQWTGVAKTITVDMVATPFLTARVTDLAGYAHIDVDIMEKDRVLMSLRSTTIQSPGVISLDLDKKMFPGTYTLRLRLIVGGPNEGCSATYDWIRLTSVEDGNRLLTNPDIPAVARPSGR